MKIRSLSELSTHLDEELAWRKKELTTLRLLIQSCRPHQSEAVLRAAICVLYAHWEGFVKVAATSYVRLVATQGLRYRDLSPNFVALGLRPMIIEAGNSRKPSLHTNLTAYLLSDPTDPAEIVYRDVVATASNLNFEVFRDLLCALGLDDHSYLTKRALIDAKLLANRNRVAHGEFLHIQQADYDSLHVEVIELIDRFRTDVENAALLKAYMRSA